MHKVIIYKTPGEVFLLEQPTIECVYLKSIIQPNLKAKFYFRRYNVVQKVYFFIHFTDEKKI